MEIHIADASNAHLYTELLDENFKLRSEIFVDEMQWRALRSVDGRERDQFDTADATYYLAIQDGKLVGGVRRHCSLVPTLLSDVFPHLAQRSFERSPDVFESTRLYIVPEHRTHHPSRVAGYLQRALWGHTLLQGGRAINFVTWSWYPPTLVKSGLRPKPLGLPTDHDDMSLIAMTAPVDEEALQSLTAFYDLGSAPFVTTGFVPRRRARGAA